MRLRSFALLTILTLAAGLLGVTPSSAAVTRVVDDDGKGAPGNCSAATDAFSDIQPAIDAASAGDTIQVCPGTYPEPVTVDKTLEIIGAQAGVDARTRSAPAESRIASPPNQFLQGFTVEAPNVVVSGFLFTGWDIGIITAFDPHQAAGLRANHNIFDENISGMTIHANGAIVRQNRFEDSNLGVRVTGGSGDTLASNLFLRNQLGILVEGVLSQPVTEPGYEEDNGFGSPHDVRIRRNEFSGFAGDVVAHSTGIEAADTTGLVITENTLSTLGTGIWLVRHNQGPLVDDNDVTDAKFAALLLGTGRFTNLITYEQNGLSDGNSAVTARDNEFTNSGYGVRVEEFGLAGSFLLEHNDISGNLTGEPGGGVVNAGEPRVNGAGNWWGHSSGPSDWATGLGDTVSPGVRFFPWSTDPGFLAVSKCSNTFTAGNDVIVGTGADEILCGGSGQDDLDGRGGKDLIVTGFGSDTARGGSGNDAMLGDQGDDQLFGNAGFDSIQGQEGTDTCVAGADGAQIDTCE